MTRQIKCANSCNIIHGMSDQVDCHAEMRIVTEGGDYDGSTKQATYFLQHVSKVVYVDTDP